MYIPRNAQGVRLPVIVTREGASSSNLLSFDEEMQAAQVLLPRSSRTIWKLLHATGCLVARSKESSRLNELREPLQEIQMDAQRYRLRLAGAEFGSSKRQHVIEICNFVDAGTSMVLWAQGRCDFHEQTALEVVISFLRRYGCPCQMTFDRDPTLGRKRIRPGFSLSVASAFVVPGDYAPGLPATSTRQECGTLERYHRT